MEGLNLIIDKIISEAKTKADVKIQKAKSVAQEILNESATEIEKINSQKNEEIERINKQADETLKSALLSKEQTALLKTKNEVISRIIAEAKERILNLPDKEYFDLLKNIYKVNAEDREGEILFCETDLKRLPDGFIKELSDKLTLSDEVISKEGFVVRYGRVEINCTFDAIIEDKYQELVEIASKML
ncbi:MAG: hypothetical protein Q4B31_00390 [Clostridia bacterium]|nr:hypothetical protein [Clostridia bacterium]